MVFEENLSYLEGLYRAWQGDPGSVGPAWAAWLAAVERGEEPSVPSAPRGMAPAGAGGAAGKSVAAADPAAGRALLQGRVDSLLAAYREVGYFYARLNPLLPGGEPGRNYLYPRARGAYEQLSLEAFGLSEADLDTEFFTGGFMQPARATLDEILKAYRETYCGSVGVELLHIQNRPIRNWLLRRLESGRNHTPLDRAARRRVLEDLIRAEEFEQFLHKTFIGQKRFSLEGAEVLIAALHHLADAAVAGGITEVVLGTAHRGRITILNRVLGQPAEEIFSLFEDNHAPGQYGGSGDVKYHLGYSTEHRHPDGGSVRLTLAANPSHLEAVDAVVEGRARGLQSRGDFLSNTKRILPVILHGDAAFSGQGVVAEVFNLAQVQGYHTGGTLHVVINNQIGFTTSGRDSRSTFFPTDVAKMTSVPVFHVNGDEPEAVLHVIGLALEFRQKMSQDVVVDIFCYRRHGHNEGDEPSFTNPRMYARIRERPSVAALYGERLAREGVLTAEEQEALRARYAESLRAALKASRSARAEAAAPAPRASGPPLPAGVPAPTAVAADMLRRILTVLTAVPEGFRIHPKLKRILEDKRQRYLSEVDWAGAEALAFGTLLQEGTSVRLSGQDCGRGTFSHRHAIWWDTAGRDGLHDEGLLTPERPEGYVPLDHLDPAQARFEVYDSPLSEYSVLGFEYGYSLSRPDALVLWEAQFGDFANGAQVVIDNFIAAAEAKWGKVSGLVLLLPHGYEGQGPEHSSAHLERFLLLCAEDNLQVANVTTPAQVFHLLRRQARLERRKPLVLMSPKSLLRHPRAVSPLAELSGGHFHEVLEETDAPGTVRRLVLASGKICYELAERRRELDLRDTALVRVEQLYPFPGEELGRVLGRFREAERFLWVQEEPENRGALRHVRRELSERFPAVRFEFLSRPASASPAVGSHRLHDEEQRRIVETALPAQEPPRTAGRPAARGSKRSASGGKQS